MFVYFDFCISSPSSPLEPSTELQAVIQCVWLLIKWSVDMVEIWRTNTPDCVLWTTRSFCWERSAFQILHKTLPNRVTLGCHVESLFSNLRWKNWLANPYGLFQQYSSAMESKIHRQCLRKTRQDCDKLTTSTTATTSRGSQSHLSGAIMVPSFNEMRENLANISLPAVFPSGLLVVI